MYALRLMLDQLKWNWEMAIESIDKNISRSQLMLIFLKKIVNDDLRAKQLFRLYYDRGEISEEQFFQAIEKYRYQ